jgi:MFS family permease
MSGMGTMTSATIDGALVFGITLALLGRLKLEALRLPTQLGARLQALHLALIPLISIGGLLLDIYGARAILVFGSALLAVGLCGLSLRPTYPHAAVSILLAGFGASALGTASIVLMPQAFFAPEETTASLNLGFVFLALGALLTSLLADILIEKLIGLRRTLAVFALLALTPAFLAVLPSGEHWPTGEQAGESATFWAEPAMWLAALMLFFYAPLEAAISLWTFALLAERGQEESEATGLLYGFWAAFVSSRLLIALAQHLDFLTEAWDRVLIVAPPLLAAVLLGNLAGASRGGRPRLGLLLLGLLLGPVLPTLLGLLFRHVASNEQGLAYGLVFAFGSLGSMLLAPILTMRTQPPLQTALRMPIFLALVVTAVALVMGLMTP